MRWESHRVRELAKLINGSPFSSADFTASGDVPLVRIRDLLDREFGTFLAEEVAAAGARIVDADVVIGMDGDFNVRLWDRGPAALNQRVCALRAAPEVDARFLAYALPDHLAAINDITYATTVKHLSASQVLDIRLPAPGLTHQHAIAGYLDRETARIDELIAEQQALVEALAERRTATIEQTVVAVGCPEVRLSRIARKLSRPTTAGGGTITAYRDGQVTLRTLRRAEGYTESAHEAGYQGVCSGDVVFHGLDGFAGAAGVSEQDGNCSPVYHVLEAGPLADANYLADVLRVMGTTGQLAVMAGTVRQRAVDFRSWQVFGALAIPLPPLEDQRARHQQVAEAQRIDELMEECRQLIALLKERRSALITVAVTGQIEVS